MTPIESIVRGIAAMDLPPSYSIPIAAKAMAAHLWMEHKKVAPATDLLAAAASGLANLLGDLEAQEAKVHAHDAWSRPWTTHVHKYPHLPVEGIYRENIMLSRKIELRLDAKAWDKALEAKPTMNDAFMDGLFPDQVSTIRHGTRGFTINLVKHSGGRFFAMGSYTHQGAKAIRYSMRTKTPYAVSQVALEKSFQFAKDWNDALQSLNEPVTSLDGLGRINEGLVAMEYLGHGVSSYIPWVDMSASVIWLLAVLIGDKQLLADLASGDFYSSSGAAFPKERSLMSPKMFRLYMKKLVMLSTYNITGFGFTRNLYATEPELFRLLWAIQGLSDMNSQRDIDKMDAAMFGTIARFLRKYPGIQAYRDWSLVHGCTGPRNEQPPNIVEFMLGGTRNFLSTFGWDLRESWDEVQEARAKNPNDLSLRFLPQEPLNPDSCRPLYTKVSYATRYGKKVTRVVGAHFGFGMKRRGVGPGLIHGGEAYITGQTSVDIIKACGWALGVHDAGATHPDYLSWWDDGFKNYAPKWAKEIRSQFPNMPVFGTVTEEDLAKCGKIFR